MPYRTRLYKREELYEQVWKAPLATVAELYGVSSVEFGRLCRRADVPVPDRSYWTKAAARQEAERVPLPPRTYWSGEIELTRWENEQGEVSEIPKSVQELVDSERDPAKQISVPASLTNPHALVEKAHKEFRDLKPDPTGIVTMTSDRLDIAVTEQTSDRALRIMDALLKALAARGLKVDILDRATNDRRGQRDEETPGTRVCVGEEWLVFRLIERYSMKRSEPPKPPRGLSAEKLETWRFMNRARTLNVPNGVLTLRILNRNVLGHELDVRTEWTDGKRTLDVQLNDFIAHLYLAAEELKRTRVEVAARRQREAEAERRKREAARLAEEERKRDEELLAMVTRWRHARDIREYVDEIRALMQGAGKEIAVGSELERHIARALDQANRTDPLVNLRARVSARTGTASPEVTDRDS